MKKCSFCQGVSASGANSVCKSCGHPLLSWWRSDRRYLGPTTSRGGVQPWGNSSETLCFRNTRSLVSPALPWTICALGSWSNAVELENFLHLVERPGVKMDGDLAVQTHTAVSVTPCCPTCVGEHFSRARASTEGRSVIFIVSCQVEELQLMGLHMALCMFFIPLFPCVATFLCLWGAQGQAWLLSDHVTGHTRGHGHGTSSQWPAGCHHLPFKLAEQTSAHP